VYETTASVSRFNDSAGQVTVLILQNTTDRGVSGDADFWSPAASTSRPYPCRSRRTERL
jgi:hypothetical protein